MTPSAEPTAHTELTIGAPVRLVWSALTNPAILKRCFFGADIVTDWTPGSPIRMNGVFKGKAYEDKGLILIVEPLHRLSFSLWSALSRKPDTPANYRILSFELIDQGSSATVVLSQANLTGGTTEWDIENRIGFENSLSSTLAALARLLE